MSASARKPPRTKHVKFVLRRGVWYAYFNTGQAKDGKPIRAPMPQWGTVGFWDSHSAFMAGRTKRQNPSYTVQALIADYLESQAYAKLSLNTRNLYRNQLAKVADLLGDFAANDLQPYDVRDMIEAEKWNAGTHNMVLAVIGVIYTWGRKSNRVNATPTKDIDREKGGQHQPWPEDLVEAALACEDATVRLAVHLLYFTGQRIGDVCAMRWGDIRRGHIFVRQGKTGKIVEPPLTNELKVELDQTPRTDLLIMGGLDDKQVRRALQKFTAARGVKTVPHGLRKNAVIVLLEAGSTIAEVAAITGQTHQVVEQYAAKVNTRRLGGAAIVKLEAHRNKSA